MTAAVLVLALLLMPLAARAQPADKTARVGWLASTATAPHFFDALRAALRDRGWIEGRNLVIESRSGTRDNARDLAVQLVRARIDVLVTQGPMVFGAREITSVPVVFGFSGDPVEGKLVGSLARPGGNLTGVAFLAVELVGKRLELLRDAMPGISRVAVLANPGHPGEQSELRETVAAARRLGLTIQYYPVPSADAFDAALDAVVREKAQAILAFPDAFIMSRATAIAEFSDRHRIPAMSGWAEFAEAGNLLTYGPDLRASWRRVGEFVDRVLRGARPADLPVQQPASFELVVNAKVAKSLGITIPPSVLARADRVIE